MQPIYLDYNATTPVDPRVADAMLPWLREGSGNPSSSHVWGRRARAAVDQAREQVAELLGCDADEVVFTSGGSEANNQALKGTAWARRHVGRHLVVSAVEHPAILEPAGWLAGEGWTVTVLPTDHDGVVRPADLQAALRPDTVLVSVMLANNETGALQPLSDLAAAIGDQPAWLHSDCAQAMGKIPVNAKTLGLDLASLAGHKLYAPKGVGALFVRRGLQLQSLVHGAGHEGGRRAGTEAVALLVGLGEACRLAGEDLEATVAHLQELRDSLAAGLRQQQPDLVWHAEATAKLPNTLSVAFPGLAAPALLERLQDRLAASAGAACHGSGGQVSGVLAAMGVPAEIAQGTVRLSVGRFTTLSEIELAVVWLSEAVAAGD